MLPHRRMNLTPLEAAGAQFCDLMDTKRSEVVEGMLRSSNAEVTLWIRSSIAEVTW